MLKNWLGVSARGIVSYYKRHCGQIVIEEETRSPRPLMRNSGRDKIIIYLMAKYMSDTVDWAWRVSHIDDQRNGVLESSNRALYFQHKGHLAPLHGTPKCLNIFCAGKMTIQVNLLPHISNEYPFPCWILISRSVGKKSHDFVHSKLFHLFKGCQVESCHIELENYATAWYKRIVFFVCNQTRLRGSFLTSRSGVTDVLFRNNARNMP